MLDELIFLRFAEPWKRYRLAKRPKTISPDTQGVAALQASHSVGSCAIGRTMQNHFVQPSER